MFNVAFSRRLAIFSGLLLPALETARRWRQWPGPIETWFWWGDDYVFGAMLLLASWLSRSAGARAGIGRCGLPKPRIRPPSWLTAAWGFTCGAGFASTLAQLNQIVNPSFEPDEPSGLGHAWMVLIKAGLVSIGLVGLLSSMREADR